MRHRIAGALGVVVALFVVLYLPLNSNAKGWDQRDSVSYLRGPYNIAFFNRHNAAFGISAAIHFAHAKRHGQE